MVSYAIRRSAVSFAPWPSAQLVIGLEHGRKLAHRACVRSRRNRLPQEALGEHVGVCANAAIRIVLSL
jgi:hypothetical protein